MDYFFLVLLSIILTFFLFSAFFSGSETGLVSCNRIKIIHMAKGGDNRAKKLEKLLDNPNRFLAIALVGNNICNVSAAILLKYLIETQFGIENEWESSLYSTIILTPSILIFGEIIPKAVFHKNATSISLRIHRYFHFFYYLFFPLIYITIVPLNWVLRKMNLYSEEDKILGNREEIKDIFELSSTEGAVEKMEGKLINSILKYENTRAREIMTPLIDVKSIDSNKTVVEAIEYFMQTKFSRLPVYEERVDNIIGYINGVDLIYGQTHNRIKDFIWDGYFVPETKKINELLAEMQQRHIPLIFVVDEHGGTSGMITNEDIAEEIVGDFLDKEEEEKDYIVQKKGNEMIAPGALDIDDVNEWYKLGIEKEGFETLGGFICYKLGKIPKVGEQFEFNKHLYTVEEATDKSVEAVRIKKIFLSSKELKRKNPSQSSLKE